MKTSLLRLGATLALCSPLFAHSNEFQKLLASDGAAGLALGSAVAVSAQTVVAGAPGSGAETGAAYVYVFDGTSWSEEAKLVALDGLSGDRFGDSVAIFGDRILVGAPGSDSAGIDAGAAYVFLRTGSVWAQEAKLLLAGALDGDALGFSAALSDDTAILGAPQNVGGNPGNGKAAVFRRSGTLWSAEATLTATGGGPLQLFGCSVDVLGDRALVGASGATGVVAGSGAAYSFQRTGTSWSGSTRFFPLDGAAGDGFGSGVSLFGSIAAVGAPGQDQAGNNAGAAYSFLSGGSGWVQQKKFLGDAAGDMLGGSVVADYRTVVAGSPNSSVEAAGAGAANVNINLGAITALDYFVAGDGAFGDALGRAVAMDVCWIASGAPGNDEQGAEAGAVYVYPLTHPVIKPITGNGTNPNLLATTVGPVIGSNWEVTIDATSVAGAASTQLIGVRNELNPPANLVVGQLFLNLSNGTLISQFVSGAGLNLHSVPVPNDPWLIGINVIIQGVVRGPLGPITLTNGERVRIGCLPEDE